MQRYVATVLRVPMDAFVRWRAPEPVKLLLGVAVVGAAAAYSVVYKKSTAMSQEKPDVLRGGVQHRDLEVERAAVAAARGART